MLTDLFNWKSNKVTLKDVKLMTFAEESGKGKAGIFVKGEVLAPAEFIDKYAGTNNPGKNERLSYAVLSRIAAHPEDFACLNMEEKAAALKTLMTEPSIKNSQARINQLPEDIFAEINNRMSAFAEQALASGKDVSETARKLGEIYNRLGAFPSGDANADNGFMTKIFGENGALSQTADLKKADDARAYAEKDPDFRYQSAMAKLREEFSDFTDMQLENIVRGLSGGYKRDITENAIKDLAAVKNALPKLNDTQLLQVFDHLSSHGTREITPEALRQYEGIFRALFTQMTAIQDLMSNNPLQTIGGMNKLTDLFQSVTGISPETANAETAEKMKEFFSHLGHALPLSCAVNNGYTCVSIKPENLPALSGLTTAFKNSINSMSAKMSPELKSRLELKLNFADAFLKEIRDHMRTGNNHAAVIDPNATPAPEMKEAAKMIVKLAVLKEDKSFNEKLDKAVSSLNLDGPQAQKLARMMIRDLFFCSIAYNEMDPMTNYKGIITEVTDTIKSDELFKKLLSADAMTEEHLTRCGAEYLNKRGYQQQL